jgi:hypothetical protein
MMVNIKMIQNMIDEKIKSLDKNWLFYAPEDLRIKQAERNQLQNIKDEITKFYPD